MEEKARGNHAMISRKIDLLIASTYVPFLNKKKYLYETI
jgi:hypothetical protein